MQKTIEFKKKKVALVKKVNNFLIRTNCFNNISSKITLFTVLATICLGGSEKGC